MNFGEEGAEGRSRRTAACCLPYFGQALSPAFAEFVFIFIWMIVFPCNVETYNNPSCNPSKTG